MVRLSKFVLVQVIVLIETLCILIGGNYVGAETAEINLCLLLVIIFNIPSAAYLLSGDNE